MNTICGQCNGVASAVATNAVSYAWSSGMNGSTVYNLCPGQYNVIATDINGCTASTATYVMDVSPPPSVFLNASANTVCLGESVTLTANIFSNIGVSNIQWNVGGNTNTITVVPTINNSYYSINVQDWNGCTGNQYIYISVVTPPTVSANATSASCFGKNDGAITLTTTNATNYTWNTGANTPNLTNAVAGIYTVTVTNNNVCSLTQTAVIAEPNPITLAFQNTNTTCLNTDGTITVTPTGDFPPYTYSWSNDAALTTNTNTNLAPSDYYVQITDAHNCSVYGSATIAQGASGISIVTTITNQTTPQNGCILLDMQGGTAPYSVVWSNNSTNTNLTGINAGSYCATVTDAAGCTATLCATVALIIDTENALNFDKIRLSPNPNNGVFTLNIALQSANTILIDIINPIGQTVATQSASLSTQETFSFDISTMPAGVYFARIKAGEETKTLRVVVIKD